MKHAHLSIFMVVNYIYNEDGRAEYAIIPIYMWNMLEPQVSKIALPQPEIQGKKTFNPLKYKGILRDLRFDIEEELLKMRNEWTRDF